MVYRDRRYHPWRRWRHEIVLIGGRRQLVGGDVIYAFVGTGFELDFIVSWSP
jgi:hypothetical protein